MGQKILFGRALSGNIPVQCSFHTGSSYARGGIQLQRQPNKPLVFQVGKIIVVDAFSQTRSRGAGIIIGVAAVPTLERIINITPARMNSKLVWTLSNARFLWPPHQGKLSASPNSWWASLYGYKLTSRTSVRCSRAGDGTQSARLDDTADFFQFNYRTRYPRETFGTIVLLRSIQVRSIGTDRYFAFCFGGKSNEIDWELRLWNEPDPRPQFYFQTGTPVERELLVGVI